jgi:LDH2 family malate/lactate/ureidoglycolate dehydrogenase
MPTLTIAQAQDLVARTLARCRTGADNARSVARALVAAEADGLKGHGLSRLPSYAAQAKAGKVDGYAVPQAQRPRAGSALIDAGHGFAYPAIALAGRFCRRWRTPPASPVPGSRGPIIAVPPAIRSSGWRKQGSSP